jgi:hypothetical protein
MFDTFNCVRVLVTPNDITYLKDFFISYPQSDDIVFVYYEDEYFGDDIPEELSDGLKTFIKHWENSADENESSWVCFELDYAGEVTTL